MQCEAVGVAPYLLTSGGLQNSLTPWPQSVLGGRPSAHPFPSRPERSLLIASRSLGNLVQSFILAMVRKNKIRHHRTEALPRIMKVIFTSQVSSLQ